MSEMQYKTLLLFRGKLKSGITNRIDCFYNAQILSLTIVRKTNAPIHVELILEGTQLLDEGSFDSLREINLRESMRMLPFTAYIKDKNVLWLNYYEHPIPAFALKSLSFRLTPVKDVKVEVYQTFIRKFQWDC